MNKTWPFYIYNAACNLIKKKTQTHTQIMCIKKNTEQSHTALLILHDTFHTKI